jgi:hypothetical protein
MAAQAEHPVAEWSGPPIEPIALPAAFLASRLRYRLSAASQQLYFWLRGQVCRGEPGSPPAALAWYRRGFLATYATGEHLRAAAVPVSKNTLTKLIEELRAEQVCIPKIGRRGYVFLLGEWFRRPSQIEGVTLSLYFEAFYLEVKLMHERADHAARADLV